MGTNVFVRGALLLLPAIVTVLAATPLLAGAEKLTLSQVVAVTLQHNGDLKAFRDEKGIRDAGKVRAGLLPNPTLELEAVSGALTGSSDESSMSIGVSQEFLLAGKRDKRLALAASELEIYRWQVADRERVLREEVETAFYDVVLAEQRIALADRSITLTRQLLDVTGERLAAGDIPELELNLVKVELARSEGARIDAEKTLSRNQARLWSFMGLAPGEYPAIDGSLEPAAAITGNLAELQQSAREKRPDLKALAAEKGRGDADISLAETEKVPNLTAGLFYSYDRSSDATGGGEEKIRDNLLGIRLSMPIPVFDNNQAGIQEARARRSSSENRLLSASRHIDREVATAYASYLNSEKILSLYKTNIIPQLQENLQLTREAYRLGEVGILAVIQEQKKFFEVSDSYLTALHDRQTARVALEAATAADLSGGVQ
ncbi:MAG: TolC family protein [Deltaproteobacteria bacterium HGW-Deltaproteobacteria-23]|nr:MAG: TolC family protein [Deltaproteobacteria bacterium HGW-Deltaproteobacteria-23]